MNFADISTASLEQLIDAIGDDRYTEDTIADARKVLACRHACFVGVDLVDSETNTVIRRATQAEAEESALTVECHIIVDGRKCYVAD